MTEPVPPSAGGPRVVVVGGGLSGLVAAYRLRQARPDLSVTVVEGTAQLGGKLRTGELAGRTFEDGADAFLARVPEAVGLATELGLPLVHPATDAAGVYARGRVRPLPSRTVLGVPSDLTALARSGVLTPAAVARAAADLLVPGAPPRADLSVGAHVGRRLGRSIVQRLVDPLLGGVYAGRADELSWQATLPQLAARPEGSLVRAARAVQGTGSTGPVFASVPGGLSRLVAALQTASGAQVVLGRPVRELRRSPGGRWVVVHGSTHDAVGLETDGVLLAVPAAPAAQLLSEVCPAAAAELGGIPSASVGLVGLAFAPEVARRVPPGSGFLVPAVEGRVVKAVTVVSQKWPDPDRSDLVLVRCSVGRYGEPEVLQRADADLVALVLADLRGLLGIDAAPAETRVVRWGGALPQYTVGHLDRVRRIRSAVSVVPGLALCGAALDGVGIPACIRTATRAAADLVT